MKISSPRFASATEALKWAVSSGHSNLDFPELYAKIFNEISGKKIQKCMTHLDFPDGSRLPANAEALRLLKEKQGI